MSARYRVILSKLAQEKFDEFIRTNRKEGKQIAEAIDRLPSNPDLGKFLKGVWEGYRKYRTGRYRVIYRVEHSRFVIYVITLDDRKDVYRS